MPSNYERIWRVVARIPRGRVATYGEVAERAGLPGQARLVGYALHALPEGLDLPWHRVVAAAGWLSLLRAGSPSGVTQRLRLLREGVAVDARGRVDLAAYGWRPGRGRRRPRAS